ncbi:MAG: hypothetical protein IKY42_05695 [Bacteroidaceae bacterium]|nr:hypothetical protein [Bacteroidaceae bacterium]
MAFQINKVDTDGYWMVGSTHIYIPSVETKVEHSNVTGSSTGRSEDGVMRIDWIRRDVRKVYLKYKYMTATELNTLFALTQGKEFTFKFWDKGSVQSMSAYVGETTYNLYFYGSPLTNNEKVYSDVEIHVIEK